MNYNTGTLYINGAIIGASGYMTTAPAVLRNLCYIGYINGGSYSASAGYDDLKIYNRWLTDAEVLADFSNVYTAV
jgi:hypothetical protein